MSSAYYRRICEKFNRGDQTSSLTPSNQYETNSSASVLMPPPNINSLPSTKVTVVFITYWRLLELEYLN